MMPRFGIIQSKLLYGGNYTVGKHISQTPIGVVQESQGAGDSNGLIAVGSFSPVPVDQYGIRFQNFYMRGTPPSRKHLQYIASDSVQDAIMVFRTRIFSNNNEIVPSNYTGSGSNRRDIQSSLSDSVDLGSIGSTQQLRIYTA